MEAIFVEIPKDEIGTNKCIIVGTIYRPPNQDVSIFTDSLTEILHNIRKEGKLLYIMGDFNINLLDTDNHIPSSEFLDNMYSLSFFPLITKPTRITQNTSTLIDNIFINDINNIQSFSGILFTGITDHFPVFSINYGTKILEKVSSYKTRILSLSNMESFANKLRLENWQDVLSSDNGSETFKLFYTKFCTLYDNAFPVKHVKTGYKTKKIWLSDGLRKSIKIKNRIYMKQLRSPCEEYTREYKRYKSCLNRLMRNAERNHYKDILDKNRNNTKKLWGILKDIINKKKSTTRPKQFVIGDEVVTNENIIADKFNDYFTNVGSNLAEKIPSVNIDPITYIRGSFPSSLFLQDVERFEVERIIRALKHSSAGYDGIHAKVLKHII